MKTNRESLFTIKLSIAVLDKLKIWPKIKIGLIGNCKILKIENFAKIEIGKNQKLKNNKMIKFGNLKILGGKSQKQKNSEN